MSSADDKVVGRLADITAAPWKNGAGRTRTLLESADQAGRLNWRISVADISRDAPFSVFAGYWRWSLVIEGGGVRLDDAKQRLTLAPWQAVSYDGAAAMSGTLLDGPCKALNLFVDKTRRDAAAIESIDAPTCLDGGTLRFVLAVRSACSCTIAGVPRRIEPGEFLADTRATGRLGVEPAGAGVVTIHLR